MRLGFLVSAVLVIVVGCSGNGNAPRSSTPVTLQGYFDELQRVSTQLDKDESAGLPDLKGGIALATTLPTSLDRADEVRLLLSAFGRYHDGLASIDAPAEVALQHQKLIDFAAKTIDGLKNEQAQNYDVDYATFATAEALGVEYETLCKELAQIGRDRGLVIALQCGDSGG